MTLEILKEGLETLVNGHAQRSKRSQIRPSYTPEEYKQKVNLSLDAMEGVSKTELLNQLQTIQELSVNTFSPLFMNQLYGHCDDVSLLGDFASALMNTSMATYEIAPLMTLIEKECIHQMAGYIGYDTFDGLLTPGGSLSNMQAMLMAKDQRFPEARSKGAKVMPDVHIYVSENAHYSFVKFAQLLGLGKESVVKVKAAHKGSMDPQALAIEVAQSKSAGVTPLMIAATAGTTVSGVYDDLEALAEIAEAENLWFHVDGSYGGSLLLVPEYKEAYLKGIHRADSVAWNPHKMMGVTFHCPALITRHIGALEASLSTEASYLFHEEETDYNLGQKSLHCGRRVEAFKLWLTWKYQGHIGLQNRIKRMVSGAQEFAQKVEAHPRLKLLCKPEAPIVCFQYVPEKGVGLAEVNQLNESIREVIYQEGDIFLNFAHISGLTVLRCVISSPEFGSAHADKIIERVIAVGQEL